MKPPPEAGELRELALVITGTGPAGLTVIVSETVVPVPDELFALSETSVVPLVVGVPVIWLVPELKLRPAGKAPTL